MRSTFLRTLAVTHSLHRPCSHPYPIPTWPRTTALLLSYPSSTQPNRFAARTYSASSSPYSAQSTATSASPDDYYGLLGVSRSASASELKRAYNSLVKRLHPDSGSGDAAKFAQVVSAYEVLSNDKKRGVYDKYGVDGVRALEQGMDPDQFGQGPMGGGAGFANGAQFVNAEEFLRGFDSFFGARRGGPTGGSATRSQRRGDDLRMAIQVSFAEAARGTERPIAIDCLVDCKTCDGHGKTPGTDTVRCKTCNGRGSTTTSNMFMTFTETCRACSGAGSVFRSPCSSCRGDGNVDGTRRVAVKIPAGVDTGFNLKVSRKGDAGFRGGPAGDLYLSVIVAEDEYFHRDGADVHVVAPISFATAALGGAATVDTPLDGKAEVQVSKGTQADDTRVLRGRGLPRVRGAFRGDQFVHFKIVVPTNLRPKQEELLRQLAEEEHTDVASSAGTSAKNLWKKFRRFLKQHTDSRKN